MFPLYRKDFPGSASEFAEAIESVLRRFVQKKEPLVSVSARVFPYLDEIAINLDGARIEAGLPGPIHASGETKEACEASLVNLIGREIDVEGVPLNVRMEVRDVVFHRGADENGDAVLIIRKARDGHLAVSAAQLDLENAIVDLLRRESGKIGATPEKLRLAVRARGARSLAIDIQLFIRKLFLRAKIDIYGQIDISDDFVAKISELRCRGDGAVGSIACNALEPHLKNLQGRTFPLMFPLGEIQLRDVRVAVADTVEVMADFGTTAS